MHKNRYLWTILASILPSLTLAQSVDDVYRETLKPFSATTSVDPAPVDRYTLTSKVLCGYQGWFNAPGDGADRGWIHWSRSGETLGDGQATFDIWPDVSELSDAEKFATGFKFADGKPAYVFSSYSKPTVLRHFRWMHDYGIDGVFVQRFAATLQDPKSLQHNNIVLDHCREGANNSGRTYALMYDLSGLPAGGTQIVMDDWIRLRKKMKLTEDAAYLHHEGKPVVAVWGVGFNDNRKYTVEECDRLVNFFKSEEAVGACTLMLGVPTYWRTLDRDSLSDKRLHDIYAKADVISPWTVGRYGTTADVRSYSEQTVAPDLQWCSEHNVELMPVAFPGFSWHNLRKGQAKLNQIPRQDGQFLWSHFREFKNAGASMVYVAMFDEVDEGTAIFKCASEVPQGEQSKFLGYEGLPTDFYLKLTGTATKWLRGELKIENLNDVPAP